MSKKKNCVGILFGGKSAEHEVSLQSARNIVNAIDRTKYDVVLIGIDKKGSWFLNEESHYLLHAENPKLISLNKGGESVALVTNSAGVRELVSLKRNVPLSRIDVIFPVLHGPFGEDGTIQGLLKLMNVPYVGAGVLGSAAGMDKDVMKRLLRDAGLPIPRFLVFAQAQTDQIDFEAVEHKLGLPFFVKPANLGSSVGIHKVKTKQDFAPAIQDAFQYDRKIIVEQGISGREIECSILGNDFPVASLPGEIIPHHEFYSYEAKYIDENGAGLEIPAQLSEPVVKKIQELAVRTFQVLCCEGLARVDMFLTDKEEIYINEINTIPGFTRISMFPKLWEASGLSQTELITRLIQFALERFAAEQKLKSSVDL